MKNENLKIEGYKRVLIAEDNAASRKYLKELLEVLGLDVVGAAATGEEAVRLYNELRPDMVILDIKMPRIDGIQAAKLITSSAVIPVILITGYSSDKMVDKAIESGIFAYIVKPVTRKNLTPAIKLALTRFNEFQILKSEVNELKDALETRKLVERAKGILMERLSIPENEAFKLLQTQSQKQNKKLKEIAETLITASKMI